MKKVLLIFSLLICVSNFMFAGLEIIKPVKSNKTSFAIIIDKLTYNKINDAVVAYRDAVEKDGLAAYIVVVNDENPEAIRNQIQILYKQNPPLEGAVFIGDVPIPMIRDAQHMTSAFKLDQERDWFDSSIPSDRFYEDFDLKFKYIKRDSTNQLCYYYSLLGNSPQKVTKEIYSGRIKPPFNDDRKYQMISDFLYKAVKAKLNAELLDNAFVYTGYGYHSESLTNWADEYVSLREQFPSLYNHGSSFKYLRYTMSRNMKGILMNELSNKNLDFALFHAHGAQDEQYLLDDPANDNISDNVSWIQRFLRSKIRSAKSRKQNVEEAKNYYKKEYDIPESWFNNVFSDSSVKADSIFGHKLDMYSDDLSLFQPEAKFIIFDECFNGSFHVENYIAGRYMFQKGNTIAAFGNTVNVLQDMWTDQLLGLLNNGIRIGQLHKLRSGYLENHIIGDPTFHFKNTSNVNVSTVLENKDVKFWTKLLSNSEAELRGLAVMKLYNLLGSKFESELVRIYKTENSFNVRMMAFYFLASLNTDAFRDILPLAINDQNGFIRIKAAMFMGDVCENKYIHALIDKIINDECIRVSFSAKGSLQFFNQDTVLAYLNKSIKDLPEYFLSKSNADIMINTCKRNKEWLFDEILKTMWDKDAKPNKRKNQIRTFRNYTFDQAIPELIKFANSKDQSENLRVTAIEALGWNYYKHNRNEIVSALESLLRTEESEAIKNEAEKSKNRIIYGANVPITP